MPFPGTMSRAGSGFGISVPPDELDGLRRQGCLIALRILLLERVLIGEIWNDEDRGSWGTVPPSQEMFYSPQPNVVQR